MPAAVRRLSLPAWTTIAWTVVFVGVSLWWLLSDGRIPFYDSGTHQFTAITYRDAFGDGDPFLWFTAHNPPTYPPLVHLVGALGTVVGGITTTAMIFTANVVFVPLLALGCYGAGTILYDRRAGALATVFALSTPLIISQFHLFLLDAPQTALVALSVWLILASKRFSDDTLSFLAGVATGFALMTKNTTAFFLAGLLAVVVLRGGWRNRRGIVLYAAGALIVAGAWYAVHLRDQLKFAGGAAVSGSTLIQYDPPAFSFADLTWYVWNAANFQLYLPLSLLAVAGIVTAFARILPRPKRDDQMPEFLAGCFIGWLVTDLLANNDPRYTMPLLVYVAVIAVGWTTQIARQWVRRGAMGVVVVVSLVTFVSSAFGVGPTWTIDLGTVKGDNQEGRVTILNPEGFLVGGPKDAGHLKDLLVRAHAEGVRQVSVDRGSAVAPYFNVPGLSVAVRSAGLTFTTGNEYSSLGPDDVYLTLAPHGSVKAPPCTVLPDGDLYFLKGPDVRPLNEADNLWCPTDPGRTYAAQDAAAARVPTAQERRLREEMQTILDRAREQGFTQAYFEDSIVSTPWFGGAAALNAQAEKAGLQPPPGGHVAELSPTEGLYFYIAPKPDRTFPEPCLKLPDGNGVIVFRGNDKQTTTYADNLYCPTRTPPAYKAPLAS